MHGMFQIAALFTLLTPVSAQLGNAKCFDGVDDHVTVPYSATFPGEVFTVMAWVNHLVGNNAPAIEGCHRALELNPNLAIAEGILGLVHAHLGSYDEAILHVENATRLSPRDPFMMFLSLARTIAALVTERDEEYYEWSKRLTENTPEFLSGWRHLAAASARVGHIAEAEMALKEIFRASPSATIASTRAGTPIADTAARDRFLDGLRKAGLPE